MKKSQPPAFKNNDSNKILQNHKNNSFLFCKYKIKLYLCSGIERPLLPIRTSSPLWEELAIGRRQEGERTTKRAKREKESNISIELASQK